ncbi:hypothetical protein L596_025919 [Steinernema carpocapsae]|uniref:Uncharacterized protein n=1 Tax=Steinernema carpocapsae TaxID=34508 RepID=A0A4U5M984_STECR|nr:hypothetical protein L596_025919 [Steinernema carpocapsae]
MRQTAGLTNKFCRLGLRLEKNLKGGPSVRAIIRKRQLVARRMLPSLLLQDSPLTQQLQQSSSPKLHHPRVDCTCSNRLLFHLFQDPRGFSRSCSHAPVNCPIDVAKPPNFKNAFEMAKLACFCGLLKDPKWHEGGRFCS